MDKHDHLHSENHSYWTQRASTYSDVNREELSGISRDMWKNVLSRRISDHFPGRPAGTIRILDIGTGFFAIILTELGYDVTAVDLTAEMLSEAKQNAGTLAGSICFQEMNAESLLFSNDSYDVIVSRNLTWNLPHSEAAYAEWSRVLKKGGLMLNFDVSHICSKIILFLSV